MTSVAMKFAKNITASQRYAMAIFTGVVVSALPASASEWVRIGTDTSGNSWMVDKASMLREENVVRAWKRIEFARPNPYPPNGKLIAVALWLDLTNCTRRVVGVKASKLLATDGSVIATHEDPDERVQWQSVAPDTVVEKSMQFVCDKAMNGPQR
jgi:hypothetical protein